MMEQRGPPQFTAEIWSITLKRKFSAVLCIKWKGLRDNKLTLKYESFLLFISLMNMLTVGGKARRKLAPNAKKYLLSFFSATIFKRVINLMGDIIFNKDIYLYSEEHGCPGKKLIKKNQSLYV